MKCVLVLLWNVFRQNRHVIMEDVLVGNQVVFLKIEVVEVIKSMRMYLHVLVRTLIYTRADIEMDM
jgi:hypothetical protein